MVTLKANHSPEKNSVFLATGSNLGDRKAQLYQAQELISSRIGKISKASSLFETAPWGNADQPHFYNQVLIATTSLAASQVMNEILAIEASMGRKRTFRYAPREIDIDILFFGEKVISDNGLVVPHPFLEKRNFVLAPLLEIAPDLIHPVLHKSIAQLAAICKDLLQVKKISG